MVSIAVMLLFLYVWMFVAGVAFAFGRRQHAGLLHWSRRVGTVVKASSQESFAPGGRYDGVIITPFLVCSLIINIVARVLTIN